VGKVQLLLVVLVGLGLLVLMLTTWGSIGSALCAFCLIIMVAALLYRKFVLGRDEDEFKWEQ
jgi:hypothetical protein